MADQEYLYRYATRSKKLAYLARYVESGNSLYDDSFQYQLKNLTQSELDSFLHYYIYENHYKMIEILLISGANIKRNSNMFIDALNKCTPETIKLLMKFGADPNSISGVDYISSKYVRGDMYVGTIDTDILNVLIEFGLNVRKILADIEFCLSVDNDIYNHIPISMEVKKNIKLLKQHII